MKNNKSSLTLKIVLALFLGASTVMTLLGAVGTACLAWNGDKYGPPFKWIVAAMPMYQNLRVHQSRCRRRAGNRHVRILAR